MAKKRTVRIRKTGSPTYIEDPARFLEDIGLLCQINRLYLHPFGLSLEPAPDAPGGLKLLDSRKNPTQVIPPEYLADAIGRWDAYAKGQGQATARLRKEALGFVTQGV